MSFMHIIKQNAISLLACIFLDLHAYGVATSVDQWPGRGDGEQAEWQADESSWHKASSDNSLSPTGVSQNAM